MKRVQAYIRLNKLEQVKDALANRNIHGLSVLETRGFGRQQGQTSTFRGSTYALNLVPKIKLDIVIQDHQLDDCLDAIVSAAQTGELGDGKIFVSEVIDAVRIRTGERGEEAL
ncbi:MAG: P-II family nitrogen regulator [Fimbriimonadaceae bacterium]